MEPVGVLMVGSVPGASSQEVFKRIAAALPGRLPAVPDGETGERYNYIGWQRHRFPSVAWPTELGGDPLAESKLPVFTLEDVKETGYDTAALSSYAELKRLRQQGAVASDIRFQIGLPSPYSVMAGHLKPEVAGAIEPLYEQRFAESIDNIVDNIPHGDVVIQWDLCFEMTALEFDRGKPLDVRHKAYFSSPDGGVLRGLVDRVERLSRHIPDDFANALLARTKTLGSRTEWIHMPVPKSRTDRAYFAPLAGLELDGDASGHPYLYLGVVHANDEAGTRKRIEAAQSIVPFTFGVATECGLGRTSTDEIDSVLHICKSVARPL
ncbi:hypothetical protein F5Y17DRAFT_454807 [Xylariaceae sp. FL0594]|nr:hypothetical protein F5Y17DRAFT_454807 [Xylariaceae sp. FL0594]